MYKVIEKLDSGFYQAFETLSPEQAREALRAGWSTERQRAYNAATRPCEACKGWGYLIVRKGRTTTRENCGCPVCLGTGKVYRHHIGEAA